MVVLRPSLSNGSPPQHEVPPEVLSQLRRTSWTSSTLDDPSFIPLGSYSRNPPPYLVGRYSFMGRTLNTPETIQAWQGFYRPSSSSSDTTDDFGEVRVLIMLGGGMDGHLHTAHGGVAATLLDEAMGTVGGIHKSRGKAIFTAYIHVDYKKPLPTPSTVIIKARLDSRSQGRKMYIKATLEDGEGTVYNTAESLFLEVERKHSHKPKI